LAAKAIAAEKDAACTQLNFGAERCRLRKKLRARSIISGKEVPACGEKRAWLIDVAREPAAHNPTVNVQNDNSLL